VASRGQGGPFLQPRAPNLDATASAVRKRSRPLVLLLQFLHPSAAEMRLMLRRLLLLVSVTAAAGFSTSASWLSGTGSQAAITSSKRCRGRGSTSVFGGLYMKDWSKRQTLAEKDGGAADKVKSFCSRLRCFCVAQRPSAGRPLRYRHPKPLMSDFRDAVLTRPCMTAGSLPYVDVYVLVIRVLNPSASWAIFLWCLSNLR
jgi:hypothetical protein